MGRHGFLAEADAAAKQKRANHARDAGVDVNDGAAREVESAHLEAVAGAGESRVVSRGEIVRAWVEPYRVGDRDVDDRQPENGEQDDGRELHPLGEAADGQRRGDRGEGHLEADEDQLIEAHANREGRSRRLRDRCLA